MTVLALILMNVLQESTLVATTAQTPLEDSNVTAHQEPLWITMESLVDLLVSHVTELLLTKSAMLDLWKYADVVVPAICVTKPNVLAARDATSTKPILLLSWTLQALSKSRTSTP